MATDLTRRRFLGTLAAGAVAAPGVSSRASAFPLRQAQRPAALGGAPVRATPFPSWPVRDALEEQALTEVVRGGHWNRGPQVERFEAEYARERFQQGRLTDSGNVLDEQVPFGEHAREREPHLLGLAENDRIQSV